MARNHVECSRRFFDSCEASHGSPLPCARRLPNFVKTLHTVGDRIFVGDLQESFHFMRYKKSDNALYVYADDVVPRHVTTALPLDYDTIAGGDTFGNFFITRLPATVSAQVRLRA